MATRSSKKGGSSRWRTVRGRKLFISGSGKGTKFYAGKNARAAAAKAGYSFKRGAKPVDSGEPVAASSAKAASAGTPRGKGGGASKPAASAANAARSKKIRSGLVDLKADALAEGTRPGGRQARRTIDGVDVSLERTADGKARYGVGNKTTTSMRTAERLIQKRAGEMAGSADTKTDKASSPWKQRTAAERKARDKELAAWWRDDFTITPEMRKAEERLTQDRARESAAKNTKPETSTVPLERRVKLKQEYARLQSENRQDARKLPTEDSAELAAMQQKMRARRARMNEILTETGERPRATKTKSEAAKAETAKPAAPKKATAAQELRAAEKEERALRRKQNSLMSKIVKMDERSRFATRNSTREKADAELAKLKAEKAEVDKQYKAASARAVKAGNARDAEIRAKDSARRGKAAAGDRKVSARAEEGALTSRDRKKLEKRVQEAEAYNREVGSSIEYEMTRRGESYEMQARDGRSFRGAKAARDLAVDAAVRKAKASKKKLSKSQLSKIRSEAAKKAAAEHDMRLTSVRVKARAAAERARKEKSRR